MSPWPINDFWFLETTYFAEEQVQTIQQCLNTVNDFQCRKVRSSALLNGIFKQIHGHTTTMNVANSVQQCT